jgi:TRAP-type C4-dicarboxylate transport system permease small subunit
MKLYKRLLDAVGAVELAVGVFLIAMIVVTITVQVVTRYAFNQPIAWVEELATYSFIWGTFIGASLGLKQDRHIKIETFVGRLAPERAAAVRLCIWVLVAILMVELIRHGFVVMKMEGRSYSIALPVAIPRMWFYSVPLVFGAASMLLTLGYLMLAELQRMRRAA